MQVTEDSIKDIWRQHGVLGLARLLLHIAIRIPAEHFSELRQDVRYGLRTLGNARGFTAVALLSLSIGLCIAACAYSEMYGLILRDIADVKRPDELVGIEVPTSYPAYQRFRERTDLFSATAAYVAPVPFDVSLSGSHERDWAHLVTPTYFSIFGVHPAFGRFFEQEQEQRRESPEIVVSYRYWEDHLGSDPAVIGRILRVNGQPCSVIGVAPQKFLGASPILFPADIWMPISAGGHIAPELAGDALQRRDLKMFAFVGRLRPGISGGEAEAALDSIAREMQNDYGSSDGNQKQHLVKLLPGGKALPLPKQDRPFLTEFFMVLGGMVLLIACANLANMTLARATNRRREIAVRRSVGASRARLMRQLLTESMLVAVAAGAVGFGLAIWVMHGASQIRRPTPIPGSFDLNPDWHALLFTVVLTVAAGLAFGLIPAWQATKIDLMRALKEGATVRGRRFRGLNLRNLLVLAEIAGSLTLVLLTGMLVLGVQTNMGGQTGFDPANLYLVSLDPVRDGYSAQQAAIFLRNALERVKTLPLIRAACLTQSVPLGISGTPGVKFTEETGAQNSRVLHDAARYVVGPDYFATVGIPIVQGREFGREDESQKSTSVIVSEALVREYWKGESALGRRIEIARGDFTASEGIMPGTIDYLDAEAGPKQVFQVVGVAKDVQEGLGLQKPHPAIYFPLHPSAYAHPSLEGMTLIVRAAPGGDALRTVRRDIAEIDSKVTSFNAHSMAQQISETLLMVRIAAWTYGFIGVCGLLLASVGLAGVTAYSVARRVREIGIRMALGAQKIDVLRLILKEGAALVIAGTAVGLLLAAVVKRLLAAIFVSVANSTATIAYGRVLAVGAPLLLAALAMLACYLPARRSVHIDPVTALRQE